VAVVCSVAYACTSGRGEVPSGRGDLAWFRREFYACLTARADALFELTDAVLCADGPVTSLVELTLTAEHRRGHGAMYDALNVGWVEPARLRRTLTSLPLPTVGGRIVLAVDVSPWLRPDAPTSPDRLFCHVHGRAEGKAQMIPGWPYSFVAVGDWSHLVDRGVGRGPARPRRRRGRGDCHPATRRRRPADRGPRAVPRPSPNASNARFKDQAQPRCRPRG
jgi:DDE superfamily endonuclease